MSRRRRGEGAGAIVREIRAVGAEIVRAIRDTSAEHREHREAMIRFSAGILRETLDIGMPRTVVLDPPAANDTDAPPESGPKR